MEETRGNLTSYESGELKAIKEWQNKEPSVASQVIEKVFSPVTWVINKVIPQKAIEGVIVTCNGMAEFLTDKKDILRDGNVQEISQLQHKSLELSDKLANEIHNWANGIAGAEGAAAGATGLPGLAADIPTVITMSFRVVHKIGLCYGYECKSELDKQFVMGVISAASSNTLKEKITSVALLQRINVMIARTTWKKMSEKAMANKYGLEAAMIAIKTLAKQLGINLTKRKASQAIPVIGAGVGAAMNVAYINDIAWAARRSFQERWLMDNQKLIASEV